MKLMGLCTDLLSGSPPMGAAVKAVGCLGLGHMINNIKRMTLEFSSSYVPTV